MTTAVLTPPTSKPGGKVAGRLFRKQVLPLDGSINYKDPTTGTSRRLDFSRDYLATIVDSFNKRAYDTVKFQLADAANRHTLDPERARGTVRAFELTDDGLDMVVDLTDEGAKLVNDHPDLPVSARIVEQYERADGQVFPLAIHHVLGTLDQRVPGMSPWQAVELANDPQVQTVDLSSSDYDTKEKNMAEPEKTSVWARIGKALGLADTATEDEVGDAVAQRLAASDPAELSPEDQAALEALLAGEPELAGAALTAEAQQAIDLANARAEDALTTARRIQTEAARSAWAAESQALLSAGVPKALVDLATPWCGGEAPAGFIDLANSETTVDSVREAAAADMRKMLDAHKGLIDLSVIGEASQPNDAEEAAVNETLEAWEKQFPAKR